MTNFRILSENFITSSTMVEAGPQKTGVVTNPIKDGTGKAAMLTTGAYTPGVDNQYKVQIDSLSTAGIGVATFKWSRNDTVIATTVVTNTAFQALEAGVQVKWSSGLTSSTDAFGSTLDQWTFEGKNLFGINQMIDRKRNTRWRTSANLVQYSETTNALSPTSVDSSVTTPYTTFNAPTSFSPSTVSTVGNWSIHLDAGAVVDTSVRGGFHREAGFSVIPDLLTDASWRWRLVVGGSIEGKVIDSTNTTSVVSNIFILNTTAGVFSAINVGEYFHPTSILDVRFSQGNTEAAEFFIDALSVRQYPGIIADLGSAKEVQAVIIQDHNFSSNSTILLKARGDTDWGSSAALEETITWQPGAILHYVSNTSNTQRFWRVDVKDSGNPDGFIEVGDLFLGPFDEMVRNAAVGYSQTETVIGSRNIDVYGVEDNRFRNRQKTWRYTLPASTDIQTLEGIFDTIYSATSGKYDPIWINPTSDSTDFDMVFFDSIPLVHNFRDNKTITLNFREVLKSN